MTYSEKLKDPRWQKKRLEILSEAGFACEDCGTTERTLHVHHTYYEKGCDPWDYPNHSLHSLCEECHAQDQDVLQEIARQLGRLMLSDHAIVLGVLRGIEMRDFPMVHHRVDSYEVAYGIGLACWGLTPEEVIEATNGALVDGYDLGTRFEVKRAGEHWDSPTPPTREGTEKRREEKRE